MAQTAVSEALAESFVIEGGTPLSGRVTAAGNKNGALPILAACLLTSEPVVLHNMPRIRDVETMVALIAQLGADVEWTGNNELRVHAAELPSHELDIELASRIRASFLLAGPLLARGGRASVPPPGGDVIGRRRLDPHIHAFAELGAEIDIGARFELRTAGLRGTHIFLDEASVMATENTVMAASLTPGETVIGNAACEPHIQDLCRFLVSLGAEIEGLESNVLRIRGVDRLSGGEWRIAPEHIEVGSFVGLAAVTGGDVTIDDVEPKDLAPILPTFERLGIHVEIEGSSLRVPPNQELVVRDDLGGQIPKIEDGPWPAFPADLTSIAVTVATQAQGTVLIFEKMFESRLFFVDKLVSMGARIILCDPHRAVVTGPARLYGQQMSSPDIRAGMAMLLAALVRRGHLHDREHRRDRSRLRADRRAPALARCADRARRGLVARTGQADEAGRLHARVDVAGSGEARAVTGLPVLDHLLVLFAEYASFDLVLEIAPGDAEAEVAAAGRALGRALADPLRQKRCRGHGSAAVPADEALAHVAVEASGRPLVVSNVDLSDARVAGLASDIVATFLRELAEGAGLTLHVRLIEGSDPEHVLEAIFKALGVALAQSCRPRRKEE